MTSTTGGDERRWSEPGDIVAAVRRRWDDGTLPSAYLRGLPCPPIQVPLRGPTPTRIGSDLGRARQWADRLRAGSRSSLAYALVTRPVGGRAIGRNDIPVRAEVTEYAQAWRLLGVRAQVESLEVCLAVAEERLPRLAPWVCQHPLRTLAVAGDWTRLLAATDWLDSHRGRGWYLRQITAEGVDTKFVERHRGLLVTLLDALDAEDAGDGRQARDAGALTGRFGYASPRPPMRVRFAAGLTGWPSWLTDAAAPVAELAQWPVRVERVLVVENLVTFLALPIPADGAAVWGAGNAATELGRLPWLRDCPDVVYSGDIDTHGFMILDGLRAGLPQARSVLMDRDTLLAHRDRWVTEPTPHRGGPTRLTEPERALYEDLVEDVYGSRVRLEQERLDWAWVHRALAHHPA